MREKIALFGDLNSIDSITSYQSFFDIIENNDYKTCVAYNTHDFLIQGIRDLFTHKIDDEQFFQIGDVGSDRIIKNKRPHLDAVETILATIQSSTLYVIDNAAKIAYIQTHGSRDDVEKKLTEKGSAIYSI